MKNDSTDVDALETSVYQEQGKNFCLGNDKIFWAMYYTIPTFHNPTGMTLTEGQYRAIFI